MTRRFRFGVQAGDLLDRHSVVSAARQAEALGYEELYSFDHLGAADPFVPLMVAADATASLRVGTLVVNNEFHHPALLARTAATLDRLSGGRVVLGIGTGYARAEHEVALGIAQPSAASRVIRLEESLLVLRSLLDRGSVSVHGHRALDIDDLGVRPLQEHLPLLVGGHGRQLIGLRQPLPTSFRSPASPTHPTARRTRRAFVSLPSSVEPNGCDRRPAVATRPSNAPCSCSAARWAAVPIKRLTPPPDAWVWKGRSSPAHPSSCSGPSNNLSTGWRDFVTPSASPICGAPGRGVRPRRCEIGQSLNGATNRTLPVDDTDNSGTDS